MSKKDAESFLEVISGDAGMKNELRDACSRTLLDFAQKNGFHFTVEEFVESIKDSDYSELSDADLEAVIGGFPSGTVLLNVSMG